jgi:hypothetical protein
MLLSAIDLVEFLKRPEGKTLEFKRDLSSPDGALKTIVAFANTAGGTFLAFRAAGAKDWRPNLAIALDHSGSNHRLQFHHIFPKAVLKSSFTSREADDIANLASSAERRTGRSAINLPHSTFRRSSRRPASHRSRPSAFQPSQRFSSPSATRTSWRRDGKP